LPGYTPSAAKRTSDSSDHEEHNISLVRLVLKRFRGCWRRLRRISRRETSMTDKHTPGPWTINGGRIEATDAGTSAAVVVARVGLINDQSHEDTANARLIAAAPELLKALEAIDAAVSPTTLGPNELSMIFRKARAAIKAAKGDA
jgi:hypothetical protein